MSEWVNEMVAKPRIVFCQCAYAKVLPAEVKDSVGKALEAAQVEYEEVADLCGMAARGDERLKSYARSGALKIIACYPRTVRCLFASAGAKLPKEGVEILNMREDSADHIIKTLAGGQIFKCSCDCESSPGQTATKEPNAETSDGWVPWFPVIDYERCIGCGQCMNFCLFGVFEKDGEGKVIVKNPRNCKTNCPACARICPKAAIIFPKYEHAPINGSEADAEAGEISRVDVSQLIKGDVYAALRKRQQGKKRFAAETETEIEQSLRERLKCVNLTDLQKKLKIPPEVLASLCGTNCGETGCAGQEPVQSSANESSACDCDCEGDCSSEDDAQCAPDCDCECKNEENCGG